MAVTYETTMAGLLKSVKGTLLTGRNRLVGGQQQFPSLSSVKTFKIGPCGPVAIYPALVVMPDNETVVEWFSGGAFSIGRQVTVYALTKAGRIEQARDSLMPLIRDAREAIQHGYFLKDSRNRPTAFRLVMGPEELAAVEAPKESLLWQASQELTFISRDALPSNRINYNDYRESTPEQLMDEIQATFTGGQSLELTYLTADGREIPRFRDIFYWQVPPVLRFPTLGVITTGETTVERFTGMDALPRQYEAVIWDRYTTDDAVIMALCDHADAVRNFIWKNYRWRNRALRTAVGTVTYNTNRIDEVYVIQASVPFTPQCWEQVAYAAE